MTIGANNRMDYVGSGSTDTYSYNFKIYAATDLRVTVRDTDDVETLLTYPTHYTVSNVGRAAGGNVILVSGSFGWLDADGDLEDGYAMTIRRVRPVTQTTDIRNQGGYFPETHEDAFDHFVMIDQQQQDEIDRSMRLPETVDPGTVSPILPVPEANKFVAWNNAASGLVNVDNRDLLTFAASQNYVTQLFSGTGAQTVFTLSGAPGSINNLDIFLSGVRQIPDVDYTLAGVTLTFTTAPLLGTDNIFAKWGTVLALGDVADNSVTAPKIASSAVTTAKIAAAAVTIDKVNLIVPVVATRSALAAIASPSTIGAAMLSEGGREGVFVWRSGDYSARVTSDTKQGVYVAAGSIASTVGAWERAGVDGVYNVKWFGATGDGSTDDYAAVQGCIDYVGDQAGGTVLFPDGAYRMGTGLTLDTALVRLEGVGSRRSSITTTTANLNLITMTAARCAVNNLSLFSLVRSTSASAIITFDSGCVQCTVSDLDIVGGYYCMRGQGTASDIIVENVVARQSIGGATVYVKEADSIDFVNCLFNQDWPAGTPTSSNDKGARANTTGYSLKDYVTLSGFVLQCVTAGTSGGSAPSLTGIFYNTNISDGSVVWQIAGSTSQVAVQIDSDCTYITLSDTDMTGSYVSSLYLTNNLGATPPDVIRVVDCTMAGMTLVGINVSAARRFWIEGCELQVPVANSASTVAIFVGSGVVGDYKISGNSVVSGFDYGVWIANDSFGSAVISENQCFGCTYGIYVNPNVQDFQIIGNNVGASDTWGANTNAVVVAVGTSNNYIISQNRIAGAASGVTDGGSGVNKSVVANI